MYLRPARFTVCVPVFLRTCGNLAAPKRFIETRAKNAFYRAGTCSAARAFLSHGASRTVGRDRKGEKGARVETRVPLVENRRRPAALPFARTRAIPIKKKKTRGVRTRRRTAKKRSAERRRHA